MTTATADNPTPDQSANSFAEAAQAVAEFRTQANQWAIADALNTAVPSNSGGQGQAFWEIQRETSKAGVKPLSISAMRQYRDTAARWDPKDRIDGVNYSVHRKALGAKDPVAIIKTVIAQKGARSKVTVAAIGAAVDASNGVQTKAEQRVAAGQAQAAAQIDWTHPEVMRRAVAVVTNMPQGDWSKTYPGGIPAGLGILLRKQADTIDKLLGVNRAPAKKVGAPAKRKAPAKKAATKKTPAAKGKGRRGRVKGA